ncbi:hypothetical protein RchiOBHm_Chr6g0288961 [Rosa chinensis]|uniref:Uncharacterized protein n=1 Tax=Rosa chinensis TaxID=74649 RepID=A0A2P6PVG3_ROSCH|nr:hypothetical protein RchiOBHm_Chr6g0288961 [Rosa chinensis]
MKMTSYSLTYIRSFPFTYFQCFLNNMIYYLVSQGLLEGVGHPFTRNFHFIDSLCTYTYLHKHLPSIISYNEPRSCYRQ